MPGKKRKYIARGQNLDEQRPSNRKNLPNIVKGCVANPAPNEDNKFALGSCGKQYKHQLCVKSAEQEETEQHKGPYYWLSAMVMYNEVCVLTAPTLSKNDPDEGITVTFHPNLNTDSISGRNKKGAKFITAGDVICTITNNKSQETIDMRTPVGGKLLELNDQLINSPNLVVIENDNSGFIAVIFPNTEIPQLDGAKNWDSLVKKMEVKTTDKSVCYAFLNTGNCSRGDMCKFKHQQVE